MIRADIITAIESVGFSHPVLVMATNKAWSTL